MAEELEWVPVEQPQDKELQEALTGTGRYRDLNPNQQATPTKLNNYETRTREQVLTDETNKNLANQSESDLEWVPVKQNKEEDLEWVPVGDSPTMLQAAGQGVMSGLGQLAHTGGVIAGGLASLVSEDTGDAIFKASDELKKKMGTSVLSEEQQAQETLPQKVVGGLAGALPYLAGGVVAPGATLATMALSAGSNTATEMLTKGVDLNRARASMAIEMAGVATMGFVPGIGTTIKGTLGLGAGTNVLQGMGTDLAINKLFPDRPDIQKQYNPWDWEKRFVEATTGAALGGVLHGLHLKAEKEFNTKKEAAQAAQTGLMVSNVLPALDKLVGVNKQDKFVDPKPRALERLLDTGRSFEKEVYDTSHQDALNDIERVWNEYATPQLKQMYHDDLDRGFARIADEHWDKLSDKTQRYLWGKNAFDAETGETHSIGSPSEIGGYGNFNIHGSHIWNIKEAAFQANEKPNLEVTSRTGNVKEALDLISEDKDATPIQKALTKVLTRMSNWTGLHEIPIDSVMTDPATGQPISSRGRYRGDYFTKPFDPDINDRIKASTAKYESGTKPRTGLIRTVLHEITHALTAQAILKLESSIKDIHGNWSTDPAENVFLKKVEAFRDTFNLGKEEALTKEGLGHLIGLDLKAYQTALRNEVQLQLAKGKTRDEVTAWWDSLIGWGDLHEFASELATNPGFSYTLSKMKLKDEHMVLLKVTYPQTIKNLWNVVKSQWKDLLGFHKNDSFFDMAFDHLTNTIDSVSAGSRSQRTKAHAAELDRQREEFNKTATGLTKALIQRMAGVLKEAASIDEVLMRLNAQSTNSEWRSWVASNIDIIWNNTKHIIETAGQSDYSKLSPAEKKLTMDDRTVDQFVHEEFKDYVIEGKIVSKLRQWQDLKSGGTYLYSPAILNIMKDGWSGAVLKFVNNKATQYKSMAEVLYHDAIGHFQGFNELPHKEKLALMDTISYFDHHKYRKELTDRGLQWLTDEMLQERGHTPAAIEAYHNMTKGEEFIWSMLNQAHIKQGLPPVAMIPGYMPHIHTGAYKVFVKFTRNSDGKDYVIAVKGFNFRQQAEKYAQNLESGKHDTDLGTYRPQIDPESLLPYKIRKHGDLSNSLMSSIQEHITSYTTASQLDPAIIQKLEEIEASNMRGFTKHLLERSDVSGYQGEFGQQKSVLETLGIGSPYNNKTLKLWQTYAKSVTEYYKNTMWVDEVASRLTQVRPFEMDGKTHYFTLFEKTTNLSKHLSEFSYNFTGENINHANWIDKVLQDISIRIGVDPLLYRRTARAARNFLSLTKLRANPGNYIANTIQPVHALALLEMANEMLRKDGRTDLPDPGKSMSKVVFKRFEPDDDMASAVQWAKEQHHLDAQLDYELGARHLSPVLDFLNTATLGKVNAGIEALSRETTFMMAYEHFRQVFKDNPDRARGAAIQLMEMTMVNYDHSSRPLMYQNFGVAGEAISPFAVFRNGYLGNTMLMFKLIAKNKSLSSMRPMIAAQLSYLATAGLVGVIGVAEYNQMINMLNNWFPEWDLPTLEELIFKHKVPDIVAFGALSEGTKYIPGIENGAYLGSSMNAVGSDDVFSAALIPMLQAMGTVVGVGTKAIGSMLSDEVTPPTAKDYYRPGKQLLPGIFQGYYEKYFMGEGSDVAPKTSSLSGGYERKPADWNAINILGRRSIEESTESTKNRLLAKGEELRKKAIKDLVSMAVDRSLGIPTTWDLDKIKARAIELGAEPEEFVDMVIKGREDRLYSQKKKDSMRDTTEGYRLQYERRKMTGE